MRRICAWCRVDLDPGQEEAGADRPVTHGICDSCAAKLWGESGGVPLRKFLDSLGVPTFLVDGNARVGEANSNALELLEKSLEEVVDHLGGEVLDCVNSELPGGCGGSELCPACTVRNTVTHSYQSGESHTKVPAALTIRRGDVVEEMAFFLSTEKVGDRVLVQVEPAKKSA